MEETKQFMGSEALPGLCEQLGPSLQRILGRYQIPAEDAEDVVQTTFLLAVARWQEIRCPGPWLLGTLQRRCILYWRARRLHEARHVELDEWCRQFTLEPNQDRRDQLADLDRACRILPAGQRNLLVLRYHLGLSPGETARVLGLAPESVRKIAHRACALLRQRAKWQRVERAEVATGSSPVRAVSWVAAMAPYLYGFHGGTRRMERSRLRAAAARLACGTIAEVTAGGLRDYRSAVLADSRARTTQAHALGSLKRFLIWAGRRRLHALPPEEIRDALRLPRRSTSAWCPCARVAAARKG